MQPLIKWPGGKSSEIEYIIDLIPAHDRYVEPFCGGGAVYFYLEPQNAIINDISKNLTSFYKLIKEENTSFERYLYDINELWEEIKNTSEKEIETIVQLFNSFKNGELQKEEVKDRLIGIAKKITVNQKCPFISGDVLENEIQRMLIDKFFRTHKNEIKNKQELSKTDLNQNLKTGISAGVYMAIRSELNKLEKCENIDNDMYSLKIALFYFIREFCYGSMFRYNKNGDFNIPFGGKGYTSKDFKKKLDVIFSTKVKELLNRTEIRCGDFEEVFKELNENDFVFVDPPYDTDFSEYENKKFDKKDHERLAGVLENTKCKFMLIIEHTSFIYDLYCNRGFNIKSFENNYSYCVKNRNNRKVKHLIVTNY